ncbi:MAG: hypothetical protein M5U08_23195 [Burkholderiales bacterium]|nr:hypothetical protein [Burkholderiales bacterium]
MMVLPFVLLIVAALLATLGLRRVSVGAWFLAMAGLLYMLSLRVGDFASLTL